MNVSLREKKRVGKRVCQVREMMGLSQRGFARELNIWHSIVAEIESGKRYIPTSFFLVLLKDLGINGNWLLLGEGDIYR